MNPPKMPVHIGDFLRDTGHLRAAPTGAYLMLLFHHWSTGSLPDDDDQLSAIARMTRGEWKKAKPIIEKFFKPGWRHGRVEEDLASARESYEKRAKAGEKGGKAKATGKQSSSNATAGPEQPLTFNQEEDSEASASAVEVVGEDPKAKLFRIGKTILVSFGVSEKRTGALIGQWLKKRNDPEGLLGAIQFARDRNVAEPVAYISTLLSKQEKPNGTAKRSLTDLAFELAGEARELEHQAGLQRSDDVVGSH